MCPNPSNNPNNQQHKLCSANKAIFQSDITQSTNSDDSNIVFEGKKDGKPVNYQYFEFNPYLETLNIPRTPEPQPSPTPTDNPKKTNKHTHLLQDKD